MFYTAWKCVCQLQISGLASGAKSPRRRPRCPLPTLPPKSGYATGPVHSGVDPNLFWGGWQNFFPHRERNEASARRSESGGKVLSEGQRAPSPPARRSGGRCKLPQWGPGRSPENLKFGASWDLKIHYRNALWRVSYYRKAKTLRGEKTLSSRYFYWRGEAPRIDATACASVPRRGTRENLPLNWNIFVVGAQGPMIVVCPSS